MVQNTPLSTTPKLMLKACGFALSLYRSQADLLRNYFRGRQVKTVFNSSLAQEMVSFLELRKMSVSESTVSHEKSVLRLLDQHLLTHDFCGKELSEDILDSWILTLTGKSKTVKEKVAVARGFAKYLNTLGHSSFLPQLPKVKSDYIPYIYSDEELLQIMHYADNLMPKRPNECSDFLHLKVPMAIRILYGCGTRLGETMALQRKDVDFKAGTIFLRKTKFSKERLIPAHESLMEILEQYCLALSELKSSLETIRSAAAEIINSIDENLAELQKAQDKEQTAGQEQPTREEKAAPKEQPQPETPSKADTAGKEKPEPEAAAPGKSGAQEKAGTAPKEAFTPETIYKMRRNPYGDSPENSHLLQAYVTQENGRAKMGDVLFTGTPEKCRELMGQLKSGELTEGDVKQLYAKAQETAKTAVPDKDTFSIYQIKGGDETRDFRFEPYDRLQAAGNVVDRANYELVYSAPLAPETSLEDIYTCFNIDHPKDFKGHSLSVSDVVVLHQDGQDAAHFVDSVGFREVPEFLQEQKQLTPDDLETGETVKTPRGTFHVTAMSREQIEAAGYGFHHQSDDGKYLIMGNGTRAFAVAAEQAQRDNPLKTAEQTTEQNGNMIDGIINNTPTVDELEAKVKAGEQISLVDLANAVKADKERGKGAKPEKKPSIRAQLRADKEKAQKKNAKQKSQDLERS